MYIFIQVKKQTTNFSSCFFIIINNNSNIFNILVFFISKLNQDEILIKERKRKKN